MRITTALVAVLTISGSAAQKHIPTVEPLISLPSTVSLGVYDNVHTFGNVPTMTFEHIWYRWDKYTAGKLLLRVKAIVAKGRMPLVTIEPWPIHSIGDAATLLPDIIAGKYDAVTSALAKEMNSLFSPIYVRWGHEMECVPTYLWSGRPAVDYIAAFREVVMTFKKISPTSLMVWSPVGNKDCELYYPGDDVVDYTGFTLFEFPEVSIGWFGREQSFADWMDQKYPRVARFNKPIIIAELGIYDSPPKQKAWMQAAFAATENYPLVRALIYFNTLDSVSWKKWGGVEIPNWVISPTVFTN
jgi:endoglucanase